MNERKPVTREVATRYRAAQGKAEKSRIIDVFVPITGYNPELCSRQPGRRREDQANA